jgi:hypothetical protein
MNELMTLSLQAVEAELAYRRRLISVGATRRARRAGRAVR